MLLFLFLGSFIKLANLCAHRLHIEGPFTLAVKFTTLPTIFTNCRSGIIAKFWKMSLCEGLHDAMTLLPRTQYFFVVVSWCCRTVNCATLLTSTPSSHYDHTMTNLRLQAWCYYDIIRLCPDCNTRQKIVSKLNYDATTIILFALRYFNDFFMIGGCFMTRL